MTSPRFASLGGLGFLALYAIHRLLQGTDPQARGLRLEQASELAVGLALLGFIVFLAALVPFLWRAGAQSAAVGVLVSGTAFVATALLSNAAESAQIAVANSADTTGLAALNQLQGRTPIVLTIAAFAGSMALALRRTGLLWRWFSAASWVAGGVFLLGFVFSSFGDTPEGPSSLYGVGLFILWMLTLCIGLWFSPPPAEDAA